MTASPRVGRGGARALDGGAAACGMVGRQPGRRYCSEQWLHRAWPWSRGAAATVCTRPPASPRKVRHQQMTTSSWRCSATAAAAAAFAVSSRSRNDADGDSGERVLPARTGEAAAASPSSPVSASGSIDGLHRLARTLNSPGLVVQTREFQLRYKKNSFSTGCLGPRLPSVCAPASPLCAARQPRRSAPAAPGPDRPCPRDSPRLGAGEPAVGDACWVDLAFSFSAHAGAPRRCIAGSPAGDGEVGGHVLL